MILKGQIKFKKTEMRTLLTLLVVLIIFSCNKSDFANSKQKHKLVFDELAQTWDEAIPLGNGILGTLVWEKNGKLRFSLDRADLWDLRPMENIDFNKWTFNKVYQFWKADRYDEVQKAFDVPYDNLAAPSKIPAGALEFDVLQFGKVKEVILDVETALCIVEWENGTKLTTFVHGDKPVGWYKFENIPENIEIELLPPAYNVQGDRQQVDQSMSDLDQLGYPQGVVEKGDNSYTYNQKGWGDFSYQIHNEWIESRKGLVGCWSVSSVNKGWEPAPPATKVVSEEMESGYDSSLSGHLEWWNSYWMQSSVEIPDSLLEKQYYLEMYKFGSAARANTPPISLQAVWTADNGKLPPWKGDFHHDLNTQLSYWPSYTGNYLNLEEGFLNWLWKHRPAFKNYTSGYFGVEGMNVPGVTTLEGEPMGGWIQYSMGQTVASWLGHHFYLHWRYSMDREFLEKRAYPWIKDVAVYLDQMAVKGKDGKRKLLISSSPEIYNNSREAWFSETTNFDLALIRWTYEKAAELARELGLNDEAAKWEQVLAEWPGLIVDPETGLMFAPGFPYNESHRHFSHLMGFHPLGLVDFSKGEADKDIITNTLANLEKHGSDLWTGYSFSWQGNLYARAFEGEKAADVLRIFAKCFCLKNSFHVNGDQCKAGHSKFLYRPFTLEGNFAFASAIQEMLIQSHTDVIKLFPAIPSGWKDVRFDKLRTQAAFLVSAQMEDGIVTFVTIDSEKGGALVLEDPFKGKKFKTEGEYIMDEGNIMINMKPGELVTFHTKE